MQFAEAMASAELLGSAIDPNHWLLRRFKALVEPVGVGSRYNVEICFGDDRRVITTYGEAQLIWWMLRQFAALDNPEKSKYPTLHRSIGGDFACSECPRDDIRDEADLERHLCIVHEIGLRPARAIVRHRRWTQEEPPPNPS